MRRSRRGIPQGLCSNTRSGTASRPQARAISRRPVRAIVGRLALLELAAPILARALEPFPAPVRTLDALHLASMDFLRANGQTVELATYDDRLSTAARAM